MIILIYPDNRTVCNSGTEKKKVESGLLIAFLYATETVVVYDSLLRLRGCGIGDGRSQSV